MLIYIFNLPMQVVDIKMLNSLSNPAISANNLRTAVAEDKLYQRVRIPVRTIYRNDTKAVSLQSYLNSIQGVKSAKANPITGKVLIIFDEDLINQPAIEKLIYQYILKINSVKKANNKSKIISLVDLANSRYRQEAALPLALENNLQKHPVPATAKQPAYHTMDPSRLESMLNTDLTKGLSREAARQKIKELGLNVLSERKRKSLLASFWENLNDFTAKLLLGVSVLSFFLGQIADAVAVLGIVLMQTALGTIQQRKAESSLHSLKSIMVHQAKVMRNGKVREIDAKYLVPGDMILLEAGDKVPADGRLIEASGLTTTEASLTGESTPVMKNTALCSDDSELGSRTNMLFMGTGISSGRGKAVVVATGMSTEIGKIASLMQNISVEPTPLQRKITSFTTGLTRACLLFCVAIGGIGLLTGRSLAQVVTLGISFSLGALPESLPAVFTIAMASSVQRISTRNAIVRKLTAIETLGSANIICCDKTGTLTMNEMTVRQIYVDNALYQVSGSGYEPQGEITLIEGSPLSREGLIRLLEAGVFCNNARIGKTDKQRFTVLGDPTEGALLTVAAKIGIPIDSLRETYPCIEEIPFDSSRPYMTVVTDTPQGRYAFCKGALDHIIEKCKTIYVDGEERLLTSKDRKRIDEICDEMAEDALRVLAFAYKKIPTKPVDLEKNYVFLGLEGMEDPPKPGVKKAIQKCRQAGIKVVMITGDHKKTAAAIGKKLGLLNGGEVLSGKELEQLTDQELNKRISNIQIFARTTPAQKYRIVNSFQQAGHIVAMTGDGVNDAPAIKAANIGIAMGAGGSDVVKDVADITLADDNFSTIVAAIEEGRAVSKNISNAMKYLLSGSFGEIMAIFLAAGFSLVLPLSSIQILWLNVVSETLLGSSLAVEPPSGKMMEEPPVKKATPLLTTDISTHILKRGAGIGFSTYAAFHGALLLGLGVNKASTLAFANLILSQLANLYDCRSNKDMPANRYMDTMAVSSLALLGGIVYLPVLNSFFGTVPMGLKDWALVTTTSSLSRI
jgi:Ca2+-transporting ATPase